eukprot:TRINITY_DN6720_c0_g1_i4.p1 TRINITY_DN6720_c0_g1~~TRINITY_DN6720_c0_g1_i4.p1  ORF type:complete len:315 (+),score=88.29 TRINITY_DN6720_c0_g1_i4:574-1518(+)
MSMSIVWGNEMHFFSPPTKLHLFRVPFMFLTNGGGVLEQVKAQQLSKKFNVDIEDWQVCLSHTPMRALVPKYKNDLVLVVGKGSAPQHIATSYGFENVVSIDQFHGQHPDIFPDFVSESKDRSEKWNHPIKAVLCFNDPLYWGRDLQILTDVARSNGIPGTLSEEQIVPFYFSGPDFEYAANFPLPRFGSGAFSFCLEKLFHKLCDRHLVSTLFGKPEFSSYRYIEEVLSQKYGQIHAQDGGSRARQLHRVYAIGDNPLSDIKGANGAGGRWRSMLVRTGVWKGDPLDAHQPHFICDDVLDALKQIVHHENETI